MHVAVLGAGYAGLSTAQRLERMLPSEDDITVVEERETHVVQHLLHRLVRFPTLAGKLTIPIMEVLDRADHRQARVTAVHPDTASVELDDGSLSPDLLAVSLGARTAFYDIPGLEDHATPLKRPVHAEAIRQRFQSVNDGEGRVIVGGAGLSGIQVAGELAEVAGADTEVMLVEQRPTVAPSFPSRLQQALAEELEASGVSVETGRTVKQADAGSITLDDSDSLAYDQLLWTGGITGQDALDGQRPRVRANLRLGERAFAVGDAASVVDAHGEAVPATAQTAIRQADVAATNLRRLADHERDGGGFEPRLEAYRYDELGWLVSVGDQTVAQVGPTVLRGKPAETLKTTVGAGYLGSIGAVENASEYVWKSVEK